MADARKYEVEAKLFAEGSYPFQQIMHDVLFTKVTTVRNYEVMSEEFSVYEFIIYV